MGVLDRGERQANTAVAPSVKQGANSSGFEYSRRRDAMAEFVVASALLWNTTNRTSRSVNTPRQAGSLGASCPVEASEPMKLFRTATKSVEASPNSHSRGSTKSFSPGQNQ